MIRIDWKGILNRAPIALEKFVSLGMSIDQFNSQKKMQRCIWEGYGRFGMGAMGCMGSMGGNYWDTSTIVNNGILQMQQYTCRAIKGSGGSGATGGGTVAGNDTNTGANSVQAQVDPGQGNSLANGRDTKFIDNDEWTALNNKINAGEDDSDDSKTKRNNYYKSGLKNLATAFKNAIDKNRDGKITKDEFVDYFKRNLKSNSRFANIDNIASAAWDNLNFNNTDFSNSLDDNELMAFLSYLDAIDFSKIDGNIVAGDIKTALSSLAGGSINLKTRLDELNGSRQDAVVEEGSGDGSGDNGGSTAPD